MADGEEVSEQEVTKSSPLQDIPGAVTDTFTSFREYLASDQEKREEIKMAVRALEQTAREILAVLQGVHQNPGEKAVKALCLKSKEMLSVARTQYAELTSKIPKGQYYRFCDHWRFVNQRFVFLAAMVVYLENEKLLTREELAETLGVHVNREEGWHIDLDDFLMGILLLAGELSRFAVNSVTFGDYHRPVRIAAFVGELDSGFRLLNLKNDSLRKKFDGLKYDLKKIEEIVYDLSIRGLKPTVD